MKEEFSNIHFGAVGRPPIDWRAFDTGLGDANDEAGPVEYDVAEVLGFDPDEDSDSEEVILNDFKNDWREVERAPAGTSEGGQWVGENSVTTEKEALRAMRKYKNGLSDDELDAFAEYTGSDYYEINRSLRDGEETILIDRLDVIKNHLDKVLEDAPKFKGTTYRGIEFTSFASYDKFAKEISVGMVMSDKSFMSTTLYEHISGKFTNAGDESRLKFAPDGSGFVQLGFTVDIVVKGKTGVFLDGLSSEETEKEVLFRRKTKFKVVKAEESFWGSNRLKAEGIKLLLELEEL